MSLQSIEPPTAPPEAVLPHDLSLHGFSYEERREILPAVTEAVSSDGCWLRERRVVGFSQVEFHFEMQLRAAIELYSNLIGTGLELSPGTHAELAGLCTLRHNQRQTQRLRNRPGRILSVRLAVNFLEDAAFELGLTGIGLA
jgi:hypothetical protein